MPVGVGLLDEGDFPVALPGFDLLFALDSRDDGIALLVPDQQLDVVPSGEAGNDTRLVFVNALNEIASDAYVERSLLLTGQQVNVRHCGDRAWVPACAGVRQGFRHACVAPVEAFRLASRNVGRSASDPSSQRRLGPIVAYQQPLQCLKCRVPVNAITIPCSSAASITS